MQTVNNNNTKLSVMMFVEWFIWGAWFVPLWQYLNKLGFSPSELRGRTAVLPLPLSSLQC